MIHWQTLALGGLIALASCSGSEAASNDAGSNSTDTHDASVPVAAAKARETRFHDLDGDYQQGGWIRGLAPADTVSLTMDGKSISIADDGRFFAAFDRDAARLAKLEAVLKNGQTLPFEVILQPREWKISHVSVSRGRGKNLDAWWKKREPEYNAIQDARAKRTGATGWQQDFIWPVRGRITGYFGRQRIYAGEPGPYHSGIDVAANTGTPIVSPADGVIVLARTGFSLEGGIVIVDHGAGLNSAFIHLSSVPVSEGQTVKQGQLIAKVGSTGRSTGPHMHWSLMWGESRIDPLLMTGPMN